ncbi:hypothetical protein DL95DRAFT_489845 [Leptodontidium sp. 2 PMI_412]|nr:hypothetical protein DL95DRAFT_489845 [Leptodontidium sp. 2 PMI_412]
MSLGPDKIQVPKLLLVTGTWAPPFVAYLILLHYRIAYIRITNPGNSFGDHLKSTRRAGKDPADLQNPDPLYVAIRSQQNFMESVPFVLFLAGVAEVNGGNKKALNICLAVLFVLRVLHVEAGLKIKGTRGLGRPLAYYTTQSMTLGLATYSGWLAKGYWGF